MAIDTSQKLNRRTPTSDGAIISGLFTINAAYNAADDKIEIVELPENCYVTGASARCITAGGGTLTVAVEADVLGGVDAIVPAIDGTSAGDADVLAAADAGIKLVPLANEKHVTIQLDMATSTTPTGTPVIFVALEVVRLDYDRS